MIIAAEFLPVDWLDGSIFGTPMQLGTPVHGDNAAESSQFLPSLGFTACAPEYYRFIPPTNGTYRFNLVSFKQKHT
jgi:hypothetical protein